MKTHTIELVALVVFGCGCIQAETIITDDITEDTTWTKAGSPYVIDCYRTCEVGAEDRAITLTIEAGAEVVFRTGDTLLLGDDAALVVNGTETDPVTFRRHLHCSGVIRVEQFADHPELHFP